MDRPHQDTASNIAYAAAAIAVGSTVMEWYTVTRGGKAEGLAGLETSVGMGTIGLAAGVFIAGGVLRSRGPRSGGLASSVVLIVLSVLLLFAAGRTLGATGASYANFEADDVAEERGISDAEAESALLAEIERGDLKVDPGLGPLVALIPGLLGILGGGLGTVRSAEIKEANAGAAIP